MRRALLVLAVLLAAYIGYPYLTLYWLDRALLTDDKASLEQLVDFPRFRATLKADLKGEVFAKAHEEAEKRPILGVFSTALAHLLAPALVDKGVDEMVTPEAVLDDPTVVEHRRRDESFVDFITYAFFASPTVFTFDLRDPEKPDSPTVTAVMELVGFRWRVVAIKLPPMESLFPG